MTRPLHPEYAAFNDRVPVGLSESPAGAIIPTHDIHTTTVAAATLTIVSLKRTGIQFVAVTRLLEPRTIESGHIYAYQPGASR